MINYPIGDAANWLITRPGPWRMAHYFEPDAAKSVCGKVARPDQVFATSRDFCLSCSDSLWARKWKAEAVKDSSNPR